MKQPDEHLESTRRRVVVSFFSGLLLMSAVAVGVGLACGDWGRIRFGWINWVIGPALTVGGLALVIWAVYIQYTLGKGTPVPAVATKKLVTQGPYAYSRNPMTLGALVMYLGIGFWLGSGVVIALCVVVFIVLLRFIYIHETRELAQRFGEPYLKYRERTPFLFPRIHLFRKDEE